MDNLERIESSIPSLVAFKVGLDPFLNKVIIQSLNFGNIKVLCMESTNEELRELTLLEKIENDPDVNQSTLATQLGVAVGTVNWHLKRLIAKGYVKVKRAERKKLRYIITPEGIALRARLAVDYVERSFSLYRKTRQRVREYLSEIKSSGHDRIRIIGKGDVADICRLTCLEHGIAVVNDKNAPALQVEGFKVILQMDGKS
jgi:DNA-binding MarR family transcriptional regulator